MNDIGHVSYWARAFALHAEALGCYARIEGMKAANDERRRHDQAQAYTEEAFQQEANTLEYISNELRHI